MSRRSLQSCPPYLPAVARKTPPRNPNKIKAPRQSIRRGLNYLYWRTVRLQGRPEPIARGLACGVFAGLFPFFGLQTILGVLLAVIFRGNKIVAAAGTWVSNPFTYIPIYAFNFHIGQMLLNQQELTNVSLQSWEEVKELGTEILFPLFVGCFAVGSVVSIFSYFMGLRLIHRLRNSYKLRQRRRLMGKHYSER